MPETSFKILMKEIPPFISSEEELVTVGCFMNKASYIKNQLTLGLARLGNQGFYAGVTNKRIIVLPIKRMTGKVDNENIFSVDFKDVEVKGNKLLIVIPDTGKLLKLTFGFGIKALSGLDKDEFIKSIYQRK